MTLSALWIRDFRCFTEAEIRPDPGGLTVLHGPNGAGKTSVLEAIAWLATLRSVRGARRETVVRRDAQSAILRSETSSAGRNFTIELEIRPDRMGRTLLNRQPVRRRAELADALQVSIFSPADRALVEGGPSERRDFLDEVLAGRHQRFEALVDEVAQVLRQRGALLKQSGGRPDEAVLSTLDVWDWRLSESGTALASARESLAAELEPLVAGAYSHLSGSDERISLRYRRSWEGDLLAALNNGRSEDLRRQTTSVGPHRDELEIHLESDPVRTHGSQGEQRCVSIALRLATHGLASGSRPEPPVLLLDDVFSELDDERSAALVELLPAGQVLLTTASGPPRVVAPDHVIEVSAGLPEAVPAPS